MGKGNKAGNPVLLKVSACVYGAFFGWICHRAFSGVTEGVSGMKSRIQPVSADDGSVNYQADDRSSVIKMPARQVQFTNISSFQLL